MHCFSIQWCLTYGRLKSLYLSNDLPTQNILACFIILTLSIHLYSVAKTNIFLGCVAVCSVGC